MARSAPSQRRNLAYLCSRLISSRAGFDVPLRQRHDLLAPAAQMERIGSSREQIADGL